MSHIYSEIGNQAERIILGALKFLGYILIGVFWLVTAYGGLILLKVLLSIV